MGLTTRAGQLVAYAAGLALAAFWTSAAAPQNWGVRVPDDVHTYGIRLRRGADLFFRPSLGWFIDSGRDLVGRFSDDDFAYARLKYYF